MSVLIDPIGMLSSSLTRLNFFDGMFLRAELLRREQSGMRSLVFQSNLADGGGIAFGLDASVDGDTVLVSPGLAIDGEGRVLLLEEHAQASLSDLLGTGTPVELPAGTGHFEPCVDVVPPSGTVIAGATALYAIVLRHRESACGWEEVRGRACEDACDASMERPYLVESARIQLCPIRLETKLPASQAVVLTDTHLRSRVAAAFYAAEQADFSQLVSAAGLRTTIWCRGAIAPAGICGSDVPVALLGMRAGAVLFVDPWIVRRERMETPPRRYWAGRVRMRPWDIYLAQALQFQCQLTEVLGGTDGDPTAPVDPCADAHDALGEAISVIETLRKGISETEAMRAVPHDVEEGGETEEGGGEEGDDARRRRFDTGGGDALSRRVANIGGIDRLVALRDRLNMVLKPGGRARRILVDGGIVEAPPAGWLPVDPKAAQPVAAQVADLMGPGVDLRFCTIRADQAAGEFESCQHLDRISLLRGIDDAARKEQVDILVPDGDVGTGAATLLMEVDLVISPKKVQAREELSEEGATNRVQIPLKGVGRVDGGVGLALYGAFAGGLPNRRTATATSKFLADSMQGERVTRNVNFGEDPVDEAAVRAAAAASRERSAAEALPAEASAASAAPDEEQPDDAQPAEPLPAPARPAPVRAAADDARGVFAWAELRLDGNPLTLGQGERGRCVLDLRVTNPASEGEVFSLDADGEFRVQGVEADGSVVVAVRGLLSSVVESPEGPIEFDFSLTIDASANSVKISGAADLAVDWTGSPVSAKAELNAHLSMAALARQNADAAQSGNLYHDRAMAALTVLDSAIAGFAKDAAAKLFGTSAGSSAVTTPHDWVLFRRRIRYDCGTPDAPPSVKDGSVDVWHVIAQSPREAHSIMADLVQGNFKHSWRRVTTARFVEATAQLRTSSADLRRAWQTPGVDGGNVVMYGGYAGTGPFVQPTAIDRLVNLVDGLKPAAEFHGNPGRELVALGEPPGALVTSGSDAAALLVSIRVEKAESICASVFLLTNETDMDGWAFIGKPFEEGVARLLDEERVVRLGSVEPTATGAFEPDQEIIDAITDHEVQAVIWVPSRFGLTKAEAVSFAKDALASAASVSDVHAIVADDFEFDSDPCPVWLFVRRVPLR